jgi:ACR3 family arsenite efflux pump ArsB
MYSTFHSLLIKAIEKYRNTCISVASCYCIMLMPVFLDLKMTKLKNHMAEQSVLIIVCDMLTH